jgi:hypothetical protein
MSKARRALLNSEVTAAPIFLRSLDPEINDCVAPSRCYECETGAWCLVALFTE